MLKGDPLGRVLFVDLTRRKYWIEDRSELFEENLGGVGVGIRLLEELCPPNADPLSPENPIILAVGPLNGLFPLASKMVALFKSPLTGNLGESHCGGRSAVALRMAGFGALVILGASDIPLYLAIHGERVFFRDARALWGMQSTFTVGRLIREREQGAGLRTIMRIGRAGENLVRFANVMVETYRHFGRLGLGAVFGSKKLKAVLISGRRSLPVSSPKLYREAYDEIYREALSPAMRKYHDLGTQENILPLNRIGALPVCNLKKTSFDAAEIFSGERLAEAFLGRRLACAHCPVGCIHLAALKEPYEREPFFYKTTWVSYDYEPSYALGSMLGGGNVEEFLKLMETVEALGLDAMSCGVVLAWATEAMERGIISPDDTSGVELRWGDYAAYRKFVFNLVLQPNDFYRAAALGVEELSSRYGGEEFALAFGGNEMPGYHTGPAAHIGHLVGARHSHLDGAGYSLDQKMIGSPLPPPEEVAEKLLAEEEWRQVLSSLVVCFFARGIYTPERVLKALRAAGFEDVDLRELGRRILRRKNSFKMREGFSPERLRIPRRILETPTPLGKLEEDYIRRAVRHFFSRLLEI